MPDQLNQCPLHVQHPLHLLGLTTLINLSGGHSTYTLFRWPRTYRQKIGAVEKWPNIWGLENVVEVGGEH